VKRSEPPAVAGGLISISNNGGLNDQPPATAGGSDSKPFPFVTRTHNRLKF
jgi:hypothetical protein